ncbi:uncharacterized protein [Physcomitrium patens]|uniref:uncharacterized protein isoform X2 n=1 Tax=Physcomitrium patens TaxID=3218 RepID=UPI003CCC90C8
MAAFEMEYSAAEVEEEAEAAEEEGKLATTTTTAKNLFSKKYTVLICYLVTQQVLISIKSYTNATSAVIVVHSSQVDRIARVVVTPQSNRIGKTTLMLVLHSFPTLSLFTAWSFELKVQSSDGLKKTLS